MKLPLQYYILTRRADKVTYDQLTRHRPLLASGTFIIGVADSLHHSRGIYNQQELRIKFNRLNTLDVQYMDIHDQQLYPVDKALPSHIRSAVIALRRDENSGK